MKPIKQKSLVRNATASLINHLSSVLIPVITFSYASRVLRPEALGRVNFIKSIAAYFLLIGSLGLRLYGTRAITKARDNRRKLSQTAAELFTIHILLTLVGAIALVTFIFHSEKIGQDLSLLMISASPLFLAPFAMEYVFTGLEQFVFISARTLIIRILAAATIFWLVKEPEDYKLYALINAMIFGLQAVNIFFVRRFISLKMIVWRAMQLKRHVKPIFLLALTTIAYGLYSVTDKVMLGYISSDTEVGYYVVAQKLLMAVIGLVVSAVAVILPRTSYHCQTKQDLERHHGKITLYFSLVMILSVVATGGVLLYSGTIVRLFAGPEYLHAVPIAQISIISVLFISLYHFILYQLTYPTGNDWIACTALFIGTVVNILLNAILIPSWNGIGAGIATLVAQIAICISAVYLVNREFNKLLRPILARWAKTTSCAAVAFLSLSWLPGQFSDLIFVPIIFGAYLILFTALLAKTNDPGLSWILERIRKIIHDSRNIKNQHRDT